VFDPTGAVDEREFVVALGLVADVSVPEAPSCSAIADTSSSTAWAPEQSASGVMNAWR
jgi:hypothetical protein